MIQAHYTARRLGAAVLAAMLAVPAAAQQPPAPSAPPPPAAPAAAAQDPAVANEVSLNLALDGAPLEDLIELVSRHTNKIFLYQDRIKMVKIYSFGKRQFRGEDLYAIFQAILELQGFALVTIARDTPAEVIKVIESRNTRRYISPVYRGAEVLAEPSRFPTEESVVAVTYQLKHTGAREVSNALRPLLHPSWGGQIIGIEGSEVLVITDFAPNVWRLLQIIEQVDQPARAPTVRWELVALRPELAKAGATQAAELLANRPSGQGRVAVIPLAPDGTTGVVVCGVPEEVQWMVDMLKIIDTSGVPAPAAGGKSR